MKKAKKEIKKRRSSPRAKHIGDDLAQCSGEQNNNASVVFSSGTAPMDIYIVLPMSIEPPNLDIGGLSMLTIKECNDQANAAFDALCRSVKLPSIQTPDLH